MREFFEILRDYIVFINIIFMCIIVLVERRRPVYTLFWVTLLILAPYFGFIIYLFFGISFKKKRIVNENYKWQLAKKEGIDDSTITPDIADWTQTITYVEAANKNNLTGTNNTDIFIVGSEFFDSMKEDLRNAEKRIYMEYFIFDYDNLGKSIVDILVEKAKAGVEVKVIVDGLAGYSKKMLKILNEAGAKTGVFFPSHIPFFKIGNIRANYRDHRKLCVIDTKLGYVSGYNIGDEYLGLGKLGYWRDTGVRIFGDAIMDMEKEFYFSWKIATKEKLSVSGTYEYLNEVKEALIQKKQKSRHIQVVSSGPDYEFRVIRDNALKIIMQAKKYIYIQTPYFVPDDDTLDALKFAALSGVDIKIMIPDKPDHPFVYWVNQYFVGELLDLGAQIYMYQNGFIHSKLIVCDDEIVSTGTANFDCRSFYQDFEINVNIYEKEVGTQFREIFENDITKSKLLTKQDYSDRGTYVKFKESVCRLLSPIM